MAITLRLTKGSELTFQELDNNFTDLNGRVSALETSDANDISLTSLSVTTASAGTAGLSYNNTTGVFTYTPPDLSSYLTSVPAQSFASLTGKPTTLAGYGITDGYDNADVDTHLNTGSASNNEVLSWNGSDYAWVSQSGGVALSDLSVTTASASGTPSLSYNNSSGVFTYTPPDLSSYLTSVPAQTFASLTGKPTTIAGYGITDTFFDGAYGSLTGAPSIPAALTDLSITDGTNGQVLTTDGSGGFTFTTVSGGGGTFALAGNTGTHTFNTATETLTFLGTTGQINAGIAANNVTLELDPNINSIVSISFEGATANNFETKLQAVDPTADRTINLPDADGTVALLSDISSGGSQSRVIRTNQTSSLVDGAEADLDITGFKSYALLSITTDRAARVRLYVNAATRTADVSRAEGVDPTSDAGLIAEVITTGADTVIISPGAYGFNLENFTTTNIPCRVTNKSGSTSTVQVSLNILQLEA